MFTVNLVNYLKISAFDVKNVTGGAKQRNFLCFSHVFEV